RAVHADNRSAILLPIVQSHFHLPSAGNRVGNNVKVGENMSVAVNNETRPLAFLRNQTIEKIEGDGLRSNVYYGADILAINRDIVLLVSVQGFVARSFGNLNLGG